VTGPDPTAPPAKRKGRRLDLIIGVLLGIVAGLAVVAAFVFLGSEGAVDAPRISGVNTGKPAPEPQAGSSPAPAAPHQRPLQIVHIVAGLPPASGPAQLHYKRGEAIRFRVVSDAPAGIAIPAFGIERTVPSGDVLAFHTNRTGAFPVVVAGGDINLASILITKR
jgi:hypothetical protein